MGKQPLKRPRWQRRAGSRPGEIRAAALQIFAEKGFAASRLDEIAGRAGVSKGTLYLYFEDKQALFRAVVHDTVAPDIEALRAEAMAGEPDFAPFVRMFLGRFATMALSSPLGAVAKMVIAESGNFPELARVWHDEIASRLLETLTVVVERAQERGEVRAGDPRLHAFTLIGPMLMGVLWREALQPVGGAPLDLEGLARQHADAALGGLLAARSG